MLTLQATPGTLGPGEYFAELRVTSAVSGTVSVLVSLRLDLLPDLQFAGSPDVVAAAAAGASLLDASTPIRADGGKRVRALVSHRQGADQRFECDLVVMAGQVVPASGLLAQAGTSMRFDESLMTFVPAAIPDGIHAAGAVTGLSDPVRSLVEGRLAGLKAAEATTARGAANRRDALEGIMPDAALPSVTLPDVPKSSAKTFTCLCMDVTTKEMATSVDEGFDSIELLKRYTTLGMGPCQGKSCLAGCVRHAAELTGRSIPETGVPTARAPWRPVELGLLAADHLEPRKESPLHECHTDLGAEFIWAGEWRRPKQYREPAEECRAVHERVAIIDVSTLGKFRVCGAGAVELLERLYPNRYGDLRL